MKQALGARVVGGLSVAVLALGAVIFWAKGSPLPEYSQLSVDAGDDQKPTGAPENLRVATYNIAHGQGIKAEPTDARDRPTTLSHLDAMAKALLAMDADIVMLQEVDLHSARTFDIDEAAYLATRAGYPYRACAVIWEKHYIPYPYWPVARQLGHMTSAMCVLSRFVLSEHRRAVFTPPAANPFWYNWFYIDRGAQVVYAQVGDSRITVVNTHLEAFDVAARTKQAQELGAWINGLPGPIVVGGDFNGEKFGSGTDDVSLMALSRLSDLRWADDVAMTTPGEKIPWRTFPSDVPHDGIDHILVGRGARLVTAAIFSQANTASDHLPVTATVGYRPMPVEFDPRMLGGKAFSPFGIPELDDGAVPEP